MVKSLCLELFQGIAIFYLFCMRHVKARQLWWDPIWNGLQKRFSRIRFRQSTRQFRHLMASTKTYDFTLNRKNAEDIQAIC